MKILPTFLLALSLGFLSLGAAQATVLVTTSTSAPATSFASFNTGPVNGIQWRDNPANGLRDVGQSFFVSSSLSLDSITFQLAADAAPGAGAVNAPFTLSVYQVASASAFPSGTALYAESGTLSGLTATTADFSKYVTFDLTDVALTGGNYYAPVLSFNSSATDRQLVWQINTSGGYSGGQSVLTTNGTSYSTFPGDLIFYATAAVPEPSMAAMFILGLGTLAWRGRRTRQAA